MLAARTVKERTIQLTERPTPVCGPHGVRLAVGYAGICGSDIHVYRGEFAGRVSFPTTQGHEFAGTVLEVGPEVTHFHPGERVCVDPIISCRRCPACLAGHYNACRSLRLIGIDLDGAFAEQVVADEEQCFRVPDSLSDRDAALVEIFSIGMHATTMARVDPGDKVVVLGAGRVGLSVLQNVLLTAAEKVAVVDVAEPKLRLAESLGAALAVNARSTDAVAAINEFTGGLGADRVIECIGEADLNTVGGNPPLAQAVEMVRNAGQITVLGQGPVQYGIPWKLLVWKEATLQCSRVSRGEYPRVIATMAAGRYRTDPFVSAEYPLEQAAQAFELVDREPPDVVKVMLKVGRS